MWPKVLAQLIPELLDMLPHIKRVIPMADNLLASRAANDRALASLAERVHDDVSSLRGELGQIYIVNAAVNQKLDDLTAEVKETAEAANQSRAVTTALGHSIVAMERQIRALRSLVVAALVLIVVLILMVGWLLVASPR